MYVIAVILVLLIVLMVVIGRGKFVVADDGNTYRVLARYPRQKEAANMLAMIHSRISALIAALQHTYPQDPITLNLVHRYRKTALMERAPVGAETSYTVGKGDSIVLCLRAPDMQLHDVNLLTFVAIHEITHLTIEPFDHPAEFWQNFKFLLQFAQSRGIYDSVDYTKYPHPYCGIQVDYNPMFDTFLKEPIHI